jgi:hypothetical protein
VNNPTKPKFVVAVVGAVGFHRIGAFVFYWHRLTDLCHTNLGEDRRIGSEPFEVRTSLVDLAVAKRILITQGKTEFAEPAVVGT